MRFNAGPALLALLLLATASGCRDDNGGQDGAQGQGTAVTTSTTSTTSTSRTTSTSSTTVTEPTGGGDCSAAVLSPSVPAQELPRPVEDTRQAIVRAAVACDYEALADLAGRGPGGFSYSFGETGAPADFWRRAEAEGEPVLRILVEILGLPFASRTVSDTTQYVWPSAYGYDRWSQVPMRDREALLPVYDQDDLRRFEQFGAYAGHRVGIGSAGDWLFFVAGD